MFDIYIWPYIWLFGIFFTAVRGLNIEGTLSEQPCTGQVDLGKQCASTKDWPLLDAILDYAVCTQRELLFN